MRLFSRGCGSHDGRAELPVASGWTVSLEAGGLLPVFLLLVMAGLIIWGLRQPEQSRVVSVLRLLKEDGGERRGRKSIREDEEEDS